MMSNKTYDILKWIAQIVLPALATFYCTVAQSWGWPYAEQISTTVVALDTFIGAILMISSAKYNKTSTTISEDSEV